MSDIFREVEEEVRRERLEKIWKEYGDYIVAVASLLILAAAGWRLWNVYETREAARASNRFIAAQNLLDAGQGHTAAEAFARLAQSAPSGYAKLSQLAEADALSSANNLPAALNIYRKLATDNDQILSAIARIRAAWILVEGAPKSDIESLIGPLAANDSPWRDVAREVLAYADFRAGNTAQALTEFQQLAKTSKASGVKGRSQAMATYLVAGGSKDFGQVPPMLPETPAVLQKPNGAAPPSASGAAPAAAAPSGPAPAAATSNAAPANAPAVGPAKSATPVPAAPKPATPPTAPAQGGNTNPKGPSKK